MGGCRVREDQTQDETGTAIAVDASSWKVTKRVALPSINMNNPHNMWTNREQTRIYQTQWFSDKFTIFNRITGRLIRNITIGDCSAHVMTRVDTDQVHVSLNGAGSVERVTVLQPGRSAEASPHSFRTRTRHSPTHIG